MEGKVGNSGEKVMNQSKIRYEWNRIPWRKLETSVFKLQKRIYQASQRNDVKTMHRLQKMLLSSKSSKLLAVRQVAQDNQGRKTPGIDGLANLSQKERLQLAESLNLEKKGKPVRRIWIPKPGKTEKRPLGIPTIEDRAKQALIKMALEPEWEAKFEPNSYGFRPGRSCHDACQAIFESIKRKTAYVLDADISGCFDNINHNALLSKLNTIPFIRRIIKGWLEAGIMENNIFYSIESGTPQGGVISPLLANVALHGMEQEVKEALAEDLFQYMKRTYPKASNMLAQRMISLIRYADDFVILHADEEIVLKAKSFIDNWLCKVGLELKPAKTRIVHTMNSYNGQKPGFDFLGFTMRQFPGNNTEKGYKLIIKPSSESQKRHAKVIKDTLKKLKAAPQEKVIGTLNPIINGWSRYYIAVTSRKVFERLDHNMHQQLWRWAISRHPNKGTGWVRRKYFRKHGNDVWRFKTHEGMFLTRHSDHHIKRYVKVRGSKSPYDGDWVYWATHLGRSPGIPKRVTKLLKIQNGQCDECRLYLRSEDKMAFKHIDYNSRNNRIENLKLMHQHCYCKLQKERCV